MVEKRIVDIHFLKICILASAFLFTAAHLPFNAAAAQIKSVQPSELGIQSQVAGAGTAAFNLNSTLGSQTRLAPIGTSEGSKLSSDLSSVTPPKSNVAQVQAGTAWDLVPSDIGENSRNSVTSRPRASSPQIQAARTSFIQGIQGNPTIASVLAHAQSGDIGSSRDSQETLYTNARGKNQFGGFTLSASGYRVRPLYSLTKAAVRVGAFLAPVLASPLVAKAQAYNENDHIMGLCVIRPAALVSIGLFVMSLLLLFSKPKIQFSLKWLFSWITAFALFMGWLCEMQKNFSLADPHPGAEVALALAWIISACFIPFYQLLQFKKSDTAEKR